MKIDKQQTLHFLTDGLVAHLNTVLAGAEVRKGTAGMIWVFLPEEVDLGSPEIIKDEEQLGAIAVTPTEDGLTLKVMRAGSDPAKLQLWLDLAGLDAELEVAS